MGRRDHALTPWEAARLYCQGHTQTTIAARYGVSQMTVSRYLDAAGVACRAAAPKATPAKKRPGRLPEPVPEKHREKLRRLVAQGLACRPIARILGVSHQTAWRWRRKLARELAGGLREGNS